MAKLVPAVLLVLAGAVAGCGAVPQQPSPDTAPPLFGGGVPVVPLPSASASPYDGLYTGVATVDVNMNLACSRQVPVDGFRVDGGNVRFGAFRGTIQPDGSTTLLFGHSNMTGHFADGGFHGRILIYPGILNQEESCTYRAELRRVAS